MIGKILVFVCLVASGFTHFIPKCGVETQDIAVQACVPTVTKVCGTEVDGAIVAQVLVPDQICADVVDKYCVPADDEATGCHEVKRHVCLPSTKVLDQSSGKIPAPFDHETLCRLVPKATCEAKVVKVAKTVCSLG